MKNLLAKLVIIIIAIFSTNSLQACGYAGGDLTYVSIGGSSYRITLTTYNECGTPFANTATINFECETGTYSAFSIIANKVSIDSNITPLCNLMAGSCSSTYHSLVKHTYEAIVTLPPCGSWNMYWSGDWRHAVSNLTSGGNCYINVKLNNSVVHNSSPVFDNEMLSVVGYNTLTNINVGGQDPDGDSLSYNLFAPYNFNQTVSTVSYKPSYSATNFINSAIPIVLDSITGILKIQPTDYFYHTYGIEVKEWRKINGVMTNIGVTHRDFTLSVRSTANIIPVLSGFNFSANNTYSPADTIYDTYKCFDGNPITFRINGYDADIYNPAIVSRNDIFGITWNNGLDNTVFTAHNNGTDSAYGEFVWTPDSSDINVKRSFVVNVRDSACPYNAVNSRHYSITLVENDLSLSNDTSVCYGDDINIASSNTGIYNHFNWTIDGNPINGFNSADTLTINSGDYTPGNHIIELEASDSIYGSACSQIKQMTLTIDAPSFEAGHFPDTAYCAGDIVIFDAGDADSYRWIDENGALQSTDRYYSPASSGLIVVEAYKNTCIAMDAFDVLIHNPPAFNLGNDTTIENNESIILSMPYGYVDYLWSDGSTGQTLLVDNTFDWQNVITGRLLLGGICSSADTIIVRIGTVGISGAKSSDINIYPNPVNDVLSIELDKESKDVKLKLYDISSKLIFDEVFSGREYKLKGLSVLPSGNYILKIINGNSIFEYNIIKK